jgi:predicted nucleic-acid-binding Zn-ribbon protein
VKNTGRCPKCSSTNVLRFFGERGTASGGGVRTGVTIFSVVPLARFVCADCGFTEHWVEDKAEIARLVAFDKKRRGRST